MSKIVEILKWLPFPCSIQIYLQSIHTAHYYYLNISKYNLHFTNKKYVQISDIYLFIIIPQIKLMS